LTAASISAAGTTTLTVTYTPDFKGFDTDQTPAISFVKANEAITDAAGNQVVNFTRASFDGAAPVIVGVHGDLVDKTKLNVTFSEPIYTHDTAGANISFNGAAISGAQLFGYDNLNAGPGSSGFTAAPVTQTSATTLQATLDAALTVSDIAKDLVWLRLQTVWDNANAIDAVLADNYAAYDVAGANIKYWIMDDVVAPWIIGITTVDQDLDGYIDHYRVKFSEPIKDSSIKGYVSNNAMSVDISPTWAIAGYTGTARWNFFEGKSTAAAGNTGKAAAAAAGKPAFLDNGVDDDVLYLEIQESGVVPFANTGAGSTGFKGNVTFGAGSNAETATDIAGNPLDTASTVTTSGVAATNGTVTDNVGPVIVGATASGRVITVLFSEALKDITVAYKTTDFKVNGVAGGNNITGYTWVNNGTLQITMTSSTSAFNFNTNAINTVEVDGTTPAPNLANLRDLAVAATNNGSLGVTAAANNAAGLSTDTKLGLWTANSPVAPTLYTTNAAARGAFTISNLPWIINDGAASPAAPKPGQIVTLKWKGANIDSVDVYASFNGGVTYVLVPNSRVAFSALTTTYQTIGTISATNLRVQSSASSSYKADFTIATTNPNGPLMVVAPNGGEVFAAGQMVNILWAAINVAPTDSVDVSVSLDAGVTWTVIGRAAAGAGTFPWMAAATNNARVKVKQVGFLFEDMSDQSFMVSGSGGSVSPIAKAMLDKYPSSMADINNVNAAKVNVTGFASAGDSIMVQLVDSAGLAAMSATVGAGTNGAFAAQVNASALANGFVTLMAGKVINGAVATWYTFADYHKDAVTIGAPSALTVTDVPGDNGGFVYVTFTVSPQHPGMTGATPYNTVQSYQLYKRAVPGAAGVAAIDTVWTAWANFPAYSELLAGNKLQVLAATTKNGTYQWKLVASVMAGSNSAATGAASGGSAKVAELLNGVDKAADGIFSAPTDVAIGGSVDDIAPSALTVFAANNTPGQGITISWTPNSDHGIVGGYLFNGVTLPIWGVDRYEVYRAVKGTTTFTLVGFGVPGSSSFLDATATPGTTVYDYYIKLVDGNSDHVVRTADILGMAAIAGASGTDFNSDGTVGLADLVLLGQQWNTKKTDLTTWISLFDLNGDGVVDLGDLVVLGANWNATTKSAKVTSAVPTINNPFELKPEVNESTSMYFVNISVKDAATYQGVAFTLNYDTKAFEFVKESVNGLVGISLTNEVQPGVINIASAFQNEKFNGTITLGFKSKGLNSDMNLRMANAEVDINNLVSAVTGAPSVTLKALPTVYAMQQNFPNPFNPTTTIEYSLPKTSQVELAIYNMAGQKVRTLVNTSQAASFYRVIWNGKNDFGQTVASGLYFYKLNAGNYSKVVKMNLIK